jgi:hypothetical protein
MLLSGLLRRLIMRTADPEDQSVPPEANEARQKSKN